MTMDIVEQMQAFANGCRSFAWPTRDETIRLMDAGAAEILSLRARVAELEGEGSDNISDDGTDEITELKAEIIRQADLARIYRTAQLTAEEKLCREQANAKGWKLRTEYLEKELKAALANWHTALSGGDQSMRPGILPDAEYEARAATSKGEANERTSHD